MHATQKKKLPDLFLKIGKICFSLGILLLPAAFFYSSILLLIAFIIANIESTNILRDKWNLPLIICSILMIIVCLISNFNPSIYLDFKSDNNLNWIGLLNWIPMFWVFWCAQYYLKTPDERIKCAFYLVLGTIPILISGFCQYYFNWYGPFKFFNETIIWYQREIKFQVFTGPFNNPNYAGTWLTSIFPFSFFFFLKKTKFKFKKIFFSLSSLATVLAIFLTNSRNAITNLTIAFSLLIGLSIKTIFIIYLIFLAFISLIFILEIPIGSLAFLRENKILTSFIPDKNNFNDIFSFPRIRIWKTTISNIFSNPFLGWGASSFSILYLLKNGKPTYQHTHNLILEIANNYGVIICLILFTTIFLLMHKSKPILLNKKFYNLENKLINKFWWVSTLIILMMHLTDITYYDGRISLLFWILIAGVRCILREKNNKLIIKKSYS
mgnify:CR=1 FL=1